MNVNEKEKIPVPGMAGGNVEETGRENEFKYDIL
jgi:hypothetical protein